MKKMRGISLPADASYDQMNSPVGKLTIITSSQGLHAILWDNLSCETTISSLKKCENEKTALATKKQLEEYFQKKRQQFDLPLVINSTSFQMQAWQQLLKIPYGTTFSYAEQAEKMGDRKKARAVGMANGRNPISIVIPCHRVIGSNGKLVGFGGGMENKTYLLELEKMGCNT